MRKSRVKTGQNIFVAISARRCYNIAMGRNFRKNRPAKVRDDYIPAGDEKALATPLEELALSENTAAVLAKGGIVCARDLAARRMREMYRIQNIGKKHCFEIKKALAAIGLDFRPDDADAEQRRENAAPRRDGEKQRGGRPDRNEQRKEPVRESAADGRRKDSAKNDKDRGKNKKKERDPYAGMSLYEIVFGKREPAPAVEKPQREPLAADSIVKFNRKGKWGYKDRKGNVLIQPVYDDAFEFSDGLACVESDGKLGYIDKEGNLVIDFRYDTATSFSEGLASVTEGEKSGYIDKEGNPAMEERFDVATPFEHGRAIVREDGRWGVLDRETLKITWR